MHILLLICITTWSFNGGYQKTLSHAHIVESAQVAAIIVYQHDRDNTKIEPDQVIWKLFDVYFNDVDVPPVFKEVKIPYISFHQVPKGE